MHEFSYNSWFLPKKGKIIWNLLVLNVIYYCILVEGYGSKNLVSGDYVKYKIDDFKMEKVIIDQTILSNYSGIPLRIQPLR